MWSCKYISTSTSSLHSHPAQWYRVVHHGLKPENILLAEDSAQRNGLEVKIGDFGLSDQWNHRDRLQKMRRLQYIGSLILIGQYRLLPFPSCAPYLASPSTVVARPEFLTLGESSYFAESRPQWIITIFQTIIHLSSRVPTAEGLTHCHWVTDASVRWYSWHGPVESSYCADFL